MHITVARKLSILFILTAILIPLYSQDNLPLGYNPDPPAEMEIAQANGWVVLFDGTEESMVRNWYLGAGHGGEGNWWLAPDPETPLGGKFWDHTAEELVLWSDQQAGGIGGVIHTMRRYKDVEVIVWFKAGWNNDGGVFLRTNDDSKAWQIVIDYEDGARVGQLYDEGTGHNAVADRVQTYSLRDNGSRIEPPDAFPVPWEEMFDWEGYNKQWQRVTGRPVHLEASINDVSTLDWSTTGTGSALDGDGMGYVGIQIHRGATSWEGGPNRYTRIELRELDENTGLPKAPVITTSPLTQEATVGDEITLSFVTETTTLTQQWYKNGEVIAGATGATHVISPAALTDAGSYTVLVTNSSNGYSSLSDPGVLTVVPGTGALNPSHQIHSLKYKWLTNQNLYLSGNIDAEGSLILMDIKGKVLHRTVVQKGDFSEYIPLSHNGLYFLAVEGATGFLPVKLTNINN